MFGDTFTQKEFDEKFQNGKGLAINLLHEKLAEAGIPHYYDIFIPNEFRNKLGGQIFYGGKYPDAKCKGDVIQTFYKYHDDGTIDGVSYGSENNLLEAMGFDIDEGDVRGFMTIDEAFEMIKNMYEFDLKGAINAEAN